MKKKFLFLILLFSVSLLQAQNADKKWAIGLGAGYYHNFNASEADGLLPELYFSRYLSPSFDIMVNGNIGYTFNALTGKEESMIDIGNLFLNLRYKFNNGNFLPEDNKFQPFIFAGPGYLSDNGGAGVNFDAGVGAKLMLSKAWSLFGEVGYIHGVDGTRRIVAGEDPVPVHDNFLKAVVGIEFAFGPKKDADGDGVADHNDKCPGTEKGVKVDKNGCPLDSDGDGILDAVDKCPKEKGLVALDGCPDTDGDGVADKDDDCPKVAGLLQLKGCPDKDGDGIIDSKDDCPDVKGVKEFDGCPDTDGDGVADKDDACPTVAGPKSAKGCPDGDGDGISDNEDECPTIFGIRAFNGCPDSDDDGVADKNDACPNTPKGAKVDAKGCPIDTDGDGVYDGLDKCPEVKGPASNNGCPLTDDNLNWLNEKVNSIFFDTNSSSITDYSKERMEKLVRLMLNNSEYKVKLFGFADPRGDATANQKLSERRVDSTISFLQSKGINGSRFLKAAMGEENSEKQNLTPEELQNSRRVDFKLFK
ncbi:MAG: OmpA family protein [Bacteroidales bacterium]|nr:OmpA family protein [Bacteroidales bacterium]